MHSQPIGRLPASNHLHLAISLPLRNAEALSNLLQQIYDPASSRYHQYLTPAQFTDMFGPTEQDYQAVIAFARSRGLTVTGTHPNRTLVDVVGSVAEVEKACHVKIGVYQHPKEARTYHAPDVEPSLDLSTPVLYIAGLDNYALPRPLIRRRQDSQNSPNQALTGSGPGGNFIGYDFRNA
jgi:subtilase family serine protease